MTYDTRGNRASTAITTHGETPTTATTTYTWTPQNMLASVTLPDSSVHSYAYDYRVRRITRTEGSANPVAMTFSGGLSVAEFEVTDTQLNTLNSQPSVEYQRGPDMGGGVGGLLYSLRSGTAKFNLSNGRGDVVAQSDSFGDLTWTASYDAYGKRPVETGTNADRQRANTKEEDPTGLNNEGWRMRELETNVWMSRDPAGFVDGPNLYAYVQQNPWTKFDPKGLHWTSFSALPQTQQLGPTFQRAEIEAQRDSAAGFFAGLAKFVTSVANGIAVEMNGGDGAYAPGGEVSLAHVNAQSDAIIDRAMNDTFGADTGSTNYVVSQTLSSLGLRSYLLLKGGLPRSSKTKPRRGEGARNGADPIVSSPKTLAEETEALMKSPEFAKLVDGQKTGQVTRVTINGRTVQYDPGLPDQYSGMTMGDDGFVIGNGAFKSPDELQKTVSHELYRLRNSEIKKTGQVGVGSNTAETDAAFDAAEKVNEEMSKK